MYQIAFDAYEPITELVAIRPLTLHLTRTSKIEDHVTKCKDLADEFHWN